MNIDTRINERSERQQERQAFQEMAQSQAQQAQRYARAKQSWKTVRQGDRWVRVPAEEFPELSVGATPQTLRDSEGRWYRG